MAEVIAPYVLTTRQRVKDRLTITVTTFDTLIDRLVSAATDFIEGECQRRFKSTTYANEVYSIYGAKPEYVFLKQAPISAITSFQYRSGTPSNPNWTSFPVDNYELLQDGASGIIRVYGGLSGNLMFSGINSIRATYTAGYLIDFANAGTATHTLPFDLTDLCERLTIKMFKKREGEGRASESYEGGSVTWKDLLDEADKMTIGRYRRNPQFI